MIELGETVYIKGTVKKIELSTMGEKLYYMDEAPNIPIAEKDIQKEANQIAYVELYPSFDESVKSQLNEYVDLLKKARSLAQDLAEAKIKLEFCLDHDGKRCPTEFASVLTNSCDD